MVADCEMSEVCRLIRNVLLKFKVQIQLYESEPKP